MTTTITAIASFLFGAIISALIGVIYRNKLATQIAIKESEIENCHKETDRLKLEMEQRITDIKKEKDAQKCEALQLQQQNFDEILARNTEQIKNVTNEMLKERQKEFSETSNASINQIVTPLKETIDKMQKSMNESTQTHCSINGELKALISNMIQHASEAKQSADDLTRVFKHGSKIQGDWGEVVLDEILTSQGLTKGIHYDVQDTLRDSNGNVIRNDQGNSMRPDVIMHLDEHREIILDSKVSMTAYIDYVNSENEIDKQKYLSAHIASLRKHVKELSEKDYQTYIKPPKVRMDYVIMFVPNSGALYAATKQDTTLWREAMNKNVFIADEQTLFAALRIISLTWREIEQAHNHQQVYDLANEMLDRVGQFVKKYESIGKAIDNARKAYDEGEKKLLPNGQSILQTCNKLQKLGARQSQNNPLNMLNEYNNETNQNLEIKQ